MKKFILTLVLIFNFVFFILNLPVWADVGATFLKISPGARAVGMGGAYTAISGDINSLYYNPAGISNISKPQIGAMHTQWISDIRYNYAAGVFSLREGVLGISATLLTMGRMEGRDEKRQPTDDFGASDFAIQFSYAKNNLGGSFKIIRQQIEEEIATGIAVDIGLKFKVKNEKLKLGFALRNLGPKMKFIKEGYNLPLTLSAGAGFTIGGVTLAIDTNYEINERDIKVSFGTEWSPVGFLSLRGGYFLNLLKNTSQNQNKSFSEPDKGLSGGFGINILNYSLDYAVVPYSDLGTTQRISFLISF